MPTDPLIPPTTAIDENPVFRICINAEWWAHVSGQISRLMHTEMWDGTDAEVYAAVQTILKFLDVGQPIDDCEELVIYPKLAVMHHEAARITAGNSMFFILATGHADSGGWYQSPSALNDEFYQSVYMAAGSYGFYILGTGRPAGGTLTWKIDGVNITTGDDWYASALAVNVLHYYPLTILTDGTHELRGKVTGKNGSSSGYNVALNRYWIREIP